MRGLVGVQLSELACSCTLEDEPNTAFVLGKNIKKTKKKMDVMTRLTTRTSESRMF